MLNLTVHKHISGSFTPPFRQARRITTWSDKVPLAHLTIFPTRAARKARLVAVVDPFYGGDVRIPKMVLKDMIPTSQLKAKMNPAYDKWSIWVMLH